jgi:hypothetical protein
VKATAYRGCWWRTLLVQGSDRGFGALQLNVVSDRYLFPLRERWFGLS